MKHSTRLRAPLLALLLTTLPAPAQIQNYLFTGTTEIRTLEISFSGAMALTAPGFFAFNDVGHSSVGAIFGQVFPAEMNDPVTRLASAPWSGGTFFVGEKGGSIVYYTPESRRSWGTGTVPGRVMPPLGPVAVSGHSVIYALANATDEFLAPVELYRKSGSGVPPVPFGETAPGLDSVKDIVNLRRLPPDYADVAVLYSSGALKRVREVELFGGGTTVTTSTIASRVQAITVSDYHTATDVLRLYWTERDAADATIVRLKSAPADNTGTVTTHFTLDRSATVVLGELAVTPDESLAFLQEETGGVRSLLRKTLADASAPATVVVASPASDVFENLRVDHDHLYFHRNAPLIARIPTNAPVATRDIAAQGLEVVQAIQNAANDCPLVEGKITHARFFARIAASSAAETSLTLPVLLRGTSGGVPLPGSPLTPRLGPASVTMAPVNRFQDRENCWTFLLPDSWTRGSVVLTAEINGSHAVSETSFTNNTSAAAVSFQNSGTLEVRFVPTKTRHGVIRRLAPEDQEGFDYLSAMLPVTRVIPTFRGGEMSRPLVPFYCDDSGIYEVSSDFDDGWLVLSTLKLQKMLDTGSTTADDHVHYVALLPRFEARPFIGGLPPTAGRPVWIGYSLLGDYNLGITAPSCTWFSTQGRNSAGRPKIAGTAAQELAHNYGRAHVNSGDPLPKGIDTSYPYDPKMLSSPAAGFIGFNGRLGTLIQPDTTADYMSYSRPEWTSDYTWRALLARFPSLPPGVRGAPAPPSPKAVIIGHVDHLGVARFLPVTPLTQSGSITVATRLTGTPADPARALKFYHIGALVSTVPVHVSEHPADEGLDEGTAFMALTDPLSVLYDSMRLVETAPGGAVLGSLNAGAQLPSVAINSPVAGDDFAPGAGPVIKWTASDPDNDALRFTVRWSADNGTSWRTLAVAMTGTSLATTGAAGVVGPGMDLPGGAQCLVSVIATDGLHSASATSGAFSYGNNAPEIWANVLTARGESTSGGGVVTVLPGEALALRAVAHDIEDLAPEVAWGVPWIIPGANDDAGSDELFHVAGRLAPGDHIALAQATDSGGLTAGTSVLLHVRERFINSTTAALIPDGSSGEPAWAADATPLPLPTGSSTATVRMVHHEGALWISLAGIPDGPNTDTLCHVALDLDDNGGANPEAGDFLITLNALGQFITSHALNSNWVPDDEPDGVFARLFLSGGLWSAEMQITDARLGGWNGQHVGLAVFFDKGTGNFTSNAWPASAVLNNPATWAAAIFGEDPDDLTDADKNGLPDQWEFAHYGQAGYDPVKNDDTDKDGQTDLAEFAAGTDPNDPASTFCASFSPAGLKWPSKQGRSYTIWKSTDLTDWAVVSRGLSYGQWQMPQDPGASRLFYKVSVEYAR